jgi:hypothetical protein
LKSNGPAPDQIIVDGNGGLALIYLPPASAWSRNLHLYHLHQQITGTRILGGSGVYPENDVYILHIETMDGDGKDLAHPTVTLEHGFPF